MITIIDYGMGNLGSIQNMFRRCGAATQVTRDVGVIRAAEKILLPGVGAFDKAMQGIRDHGLYDVLDHKAQVEKIPVLGICLGMQLLTRSSDEGVLPGFGWINAVTRRLPMLPGLKIPHMGWNLVAGKTNPLTLNLPSDARFYFVHSYYVKVADESDSVLKARYGLDFDAAINHGNVFGAQFHPEKSHKFGMQIFKNFAAI